MRKTTKAAVLSLVAAWALLVSPLLWRVAQAQTGNSDIDRGIALYDDLEYEQAAEVLAAALAQPGLSVQELVEGYRVLALCYVALDRDDEARAAFKKLLEADPSYVLPRTESPKALDLFDEVKQSMPPPEGAVRMTQSVTPSTPRRGQPLLVAIAVIDQGGRHARVTVYHRVKGQRSYSSIKAQASGAGRYSATISGAFVEPPGVEYYVVAEAADGRALVGEGSAEEPLLVVVDKKGAVAAPIYGKWWFWATIGGLLAAGTIVGLALAGGDPANPDPNATVNITIDYTPPP